MSSKIFADMASQMRPSGDLLASLDNSLSSVDSLDSVDPGLKSPESTAAAASAGALTQSSELIRSSQSGRPSRSIWSSKTLKTRRSLVGALVAAVCALALALSAFALGGGGSTIPNPLVGVAPLRFISGVTADYSDLYAAIKNAWGSSRGGDPTLPNGVSMDGRGNLNAGNTNSGPVVAPAGTGAENSGSTITFTGTNVQVAGIDEGDIVKTNGREIFVLKEDRIIVLAADGAGTREIARIDLPSAGNPGSGERYDWASDLILYEDGASKSTLVAIQEQCDTRPLDPAGAADVWFVADCYTNAILYDVTTPTAPVHMATLGQSGYYTTARLQGTLLYLVSNYYVDSYGSDIDADDPQTFVPRLTDGDSASLVPAADIAICPTPEAPSYTVVTSINVATGTRVGQESVLGTTGAAYMNGSSLYLSGTTSGLGMVIDDVVTLPVDLPTVAPTEMPPTPVPASPTTSQPAPSAVAPTQQSTQSPAPATWPDKTTEPSVTVDSVSEPPESPDPFQPPTGPTSGPTATTEPPDATSAPDAPENGSEPYESPMPGPITKLDNTASTTLVRIALADGQLNVAASASVPGWLVNQFAMDEYEGHLRVAVTQAGTEWSSNSALYILDSQLQVVGKIDPLMTNESVQSVRFDGPIGYVVTFLQTDPLFAIDLSVPSSPVVMSELKIPGFSSYLHPWGEDRLLGLGVQGDEQGVTSGMKLSVFDVSDPFAVQEIQTLALDYDYSSAQYDHHAILASEAHGLVGFPVSVCGDDSSGYVCSERYVVYRDGESGFALAADMQLGAEAYAVRGIIIGTNLYVWNGVSMRVYTSDSFARLAEIVID